MAISGTSLRVRKINKDLLIIMPMLQVAAYDIKQQNFMASKLR